MRDSFLQPCAGGPGKTLDPHYSSERKGRVGFIEQARVRRYEVCQLGQGYVRHWPTTLAEPCAVRNEVRNRAFFPDEVTAGLRSPIKIFQMEGVDFRFEMSRIFS
jgi:hypothetical protein